MASNDISILMASFIYFVLLSLIWKQWPFINMKSSEK